MKLAESHVDIRQFSREICQHVIALVKEKEEEEEKKKNEDTKVVEEEEEREEEEKKNEPLSNGW